MFTSPNADPRISELHDLLVLEADARGNPYCMASIAEAKRYKADALRIAAELAGPARFGLQSAPSS